MNVSEKEHDMMKVKLQHLLGLAALGVTLLTVPVLTWAGTVYLTEVGVDGDHAGGSMAGAYYSLDNTQFIGCDLYATPYEAPMIYCYARNSAGRGLNCTSTAERFVEKTRSMTDSSRIFFRVDSAAKCAELQIVNDSGFIP